MNRAIEVACEVARREWARVEVEYPSVASRLRALGKAEVAELLADLKDTYNSAGPKRATKVAEAWAGWYPRYVQATADALVLELQPMSECARKAQSRVLNRRARLIDGAVSVLWRLERAPNGLGSLSGEILRRGMGMPQKKFTASVALLEAAGAVRRPGAGDRLVATASAGLVREALVALDASLIDRLEALECGAVQHET